MYLICVEGGDGSGKGEAARILGELLNEFPFPEVVMTHEPRRHSELGKLALQSVKLGNKTPLEEAGLFAADRLDHSHTFIRPHLASGAVVISDRNIHSSLIYQGVVGDLGLEKVASMNAAAMIPDLVFWIDCDPKKAMKRIKSGTLRMTSQKQEYFETQEIQTTIRQGFHELFGDTGVVPTPFNQCCVVGPIMNEGGLDELKTKLRAELRRFFNKKPLPLNVDRDEVDRNLLNALVRDVKKQRRLPGAPQEKTAIHIGWLGGKSPAQWMEEAEENWPVASAQEHDVPASPLAHSCWSILGTLSLMVGSSEVPAFTQRSDPCAWSLNGTPNDSSSGCWQKTGCINSKIIRPSAMLNSSNSEKNDLVLHASPSPCGRFEPNSLHGGEPTKTRHGPLHWRKSSMLRKDEISQRR